MSQKNKIGVFVVALVVLSVAVAATAFTSGSVDRQANVNVVSDDTGLIGLTDGTSGGLVFQNASGALEIDFTKNGAGGANTEAHFELGNPNNPTNQTAFNVTNNAATAKDMTFDFSGSDSQDADANIEFQIYDSSGTQVATLSEESGSVTVTGVASGETLYVVMVIDTHGLDSTADLSGTLTISV